MMEVSLDIYANGDEETSFITGGYATWGGGILIQENATCIMYGVNLFENKSSANTSNAGGAGIYVRATLKMYDGCLISQYSEVNGSGIYIDSTGKAEISRTRLINNRSGLETKKGGAIFSYGSLTIENATFMNNESGNLGGRFVLILPNKI